MEALYTVAKLPRPISSMRRKLPTLISACAGSRALLEEDEDEDGFDAMIVRGRATPRSSDDLRCRCSITTAGVERESALTRSAWHRTWREFDEADGLRLVSKVDVQSDTRGRS